MLILGYLIPDRLLIDAIRCRELQRVEVLKEEKLTSVSAIMQELLLWPSGRCNFTHRQDLSWSLVIVILFLV